MIVAASPKLRFVHSVHVAALFLNGVLEHPGNTSNTSCSLKNEELLVLKLCFKAPIPALVKMYILKSNVSEGLKKLICISSYIKLMCDFSHSKKCQQ